ncbi:hypothetical protein FACS1894133_5750 [Clostridia bacterium]|nr:hypothetical protein FACS1894133_5750 [Clostridia bacterium]
MSNYVNATQNTASRAPVRTFNKFEYYLEDCDCKMCKYFKGEKGCGRSVCACKDEQRDAIAHGRIKRRKNWNKFNIE